MGQEAPFAIKGGAVTMETLRKEDHNVRLGFTPLTHRRVGHLAEAQRRHRLPHSERTPDRSKSGVLAHFGCIVLDAVEEANAEVPAQIG